MMPQSSSRLLYLRTPSAFHLRLGWLDVMVRLLGNAPQSLSTLAESLPRVARNFDRWMTLAGLEGRPKGALTPSHVHDLTRMLISYGLYEERDPQGVLNDAGQVLRATPEPDSPFRWEGARRWIGFWLVMRADGDVTLTVVRDWPETGLTRTDINKFMAGGVGGLGNS